MSEETQTPAVETPTEAPAPQPEGSPRDRAVAAFTRAMGHQPPAEAGPGDGGGDEEPKPAAAAPPQAPAAEDTDTRLSRLYAQATEAEQKFRRAEQSNRELQQQVQELKAFKDALTKDPDKAMETLGIDPNMLVRKRLGLDDKPETPEEVARRAVERVEQLERQQAEREKQNAQYAEQERQAELQDQVQGFLQDNGFHALSTSAPAVRSLAARLYQEERSGAFKGHSVEAITNYCKKLAENYDKQLTTEVSSYVSAEGAIDRLLADEAIAKRIREKLGIQDVRKPNGGQARDAEGVGNEPRTISDDIAAQPGGVSSPGVNGHFDPSDARRRAMQALARSFQQTK